MKLIDMARSAADKKREREAYKETAVDDQPDYPYGLSLHLNDETVAKLDLSDIDTENGVEIMAVGVVTEESANKVGGKVRRSMTIQITKLAVEPKASDKSATEVLYPEA